MKHLTFLLALSVSFASFSQDQQEIIDVLDYNVFLSVYDEHDTILVSERVTLKLLQRVDSFYLDLHSVQGGKGMKVLSASSGIVADEEVTVPYTHRDDQLWISCSTIPVGEKFHVELLFSGIPETGLIIGENKFGKRTFFGDNWPNRAHHWFACVDHPADKATVSFFVTHPKKYDVIATGTYLSEGELPGQRMSSYRSEINLPTKVMVVGIAEFDTEVINHDHSELFEMHAWVYEDGAENGFKDMAVAADVVNYFVKEIGAYPFEKLDHVQSTTQFGGMENAGNIFYDENAVTGQEKMEALIAHEVAHQWFGNSASEADWQHLWLSEGFATYFTDLYWENKYGTEAMNERLLNERNRVILFSKRYDHPVLDTTYASLMDLLNPNSYQKGAWFLHMLRNEVGDAAFWSGIRTYYEKFKYGNATTKDFEQVMKEVSKQDLSVFFHQWLRESLHPILLINNDRKCGKDFLEIEQQQSHVFEFDLEVEVLFKDGSSELRTLHVSKQKERFKLKTKKKISGFKYDPNVKLLFEMVEY
ncbi:MAG: M1 family metallopeptidase [Flavobacteriales bacterium]|nr:M1 family metallopeptidase [Flavobacteriales bacterium]